MNRTHLENTLAVGQLEIRHLQHHRARFAEVDDAHQRHENRHIQAVRHRAEQAAQKERAGVTHKDLGGKEVPHQKTDTAACHSRRENVHAEHMAHTRNHHENDGGEKRHRGTETVNAVGQIDRVDKSHDHDQRNRIEPEMNVHIAEEGNRGDSRVAHQRNRQQIGARNQHHQNHLLRGRQSFVLLLDDLDIVVQESDRAEQQRHQNARHHPEPICLIFIIGGNPPRRLQMMIDGQAHQKRRQNAGDKHDTAHRGRTLFFLMPLGTDILDGLTVFELVQPRYDLLSQKRGGAE